jgi:ribokinase
MTASARVAVVGHCEWAEFVEVEEVPRAGQIVHARSSGLEAAGGGAVAAVQAARLTGSCRFFTALGKDEPGDLAAAGLEARGLDLHAARRDCPQRRAFVFLDDRGERTITTIGERLGPSGDDPLPWQDLETCDAVYLTAGDAAAMVAARSARSLVATVRARSALAESGVQVDVLVASVNDRGEQYSRGDIEPVPRWVVRTDGPHGGTLESADGKLGHWASKPVPGTRGDSYGAGDSFAAGLTCGLGMGLEVQEAITLGAYCGASAVRGSGPYGAQASAADLAAWRELYAVSG